MTDKFKLRLPKKTMKELFADLVSKYGEDNELEVFNYCTDNGVELAGSTIDRISIVGSDIVFFYNENTGDSDYLECFKDKDLLEFYNDLKIAIEEDKEDTMNISFEVNLSVSEKDYDKCYDYLKEMEKEITNKIFNEFGCNLETYLN